MALSQQIVINLTHTTCLNCFLYPKWGSQDLGMNYAYFGLFYLPSSLAWIQLTNAIKRKAFTHFTEYQLNNFQLMYFASKPALFFDLVFHHIGYQCLLVGGLYYLMKSWKGSEKSLSQIASDSALDLVKVRFNLSLVSMVLDIWIPQLEWRARKVTSDPKELLKSKKLRMCFFAKNQVVNLIWHYSILECFRKNA